MVNSCSSLRDAVLLVISHKMMFSICVLVDTSNIDFINWMPNIHLRRNIIRSSSSKLHWKEIVWEEGEFITILGLFLLFIVVILWGWRANVQQFHDIVWLFLLWTDLVPWIDNVVKVIIILAVWWFSTLNVFLGWLLVLVLLAFGHGDLLKDLKSLCFGVFHVWFLWLVCC